MLKYELQTAADRLIRDIFAVQPEETVVITADTSSNFDVVDAVASSVVAVGAKPMVITVKTPGGVGKAADPDLPVEALSAVLSKADVWLEFNHQWLLYSTPFSVAERANKKMRYMCLVDFEPGVMWRLLGKVDCSKLKEFMLHAKELHKKAKTMRVTTPAGTDVHFEMDQNHYMTCDYGDATTPGIYMVPGQLNVVPKFGTVEGKIVFDGTVTPPFSSALKEPIVLTIEHGVIVKVEGGSQAREYDAWLHSFEDEGMLKIAHVAYGFNPGATLTGNVVEDERVWGCTEWGIGFVSEIDAPPVGQDAKSHSDGICLNASVWLDDKPLMLDGKIVHEELVPLSPVK
ncbi:aminopeptidase [Flintibacter sp. KGMB00164]|uniref:aminopeptidase n=1 Tax=Flintibacter sp. KGMB00164 TaxID=2610895 RepID=UPI0012475272|nr:aminopeptidase [Flintibacter sp. KGMB00164]